MVAYGMNRVLFSFLFFSFFLKKKKMEINCQCIKNNGIVLDVLLVWDNTEKLFQPMLHVDKLKKIYAILDVLYSCHLDVRFGLCEYNSNSGFVPRLQFTRSIPDIFQNLMLYAKFFSNKYTKLTEPLFFSSIIQDICTEEYTFFDWRLSDPSNVDNVWSVSSNGKSSKLIKLIIVITNAPCDPNTYYFENISLDNTFDNTVETKKAMDFRYLLVGPYNFMLCWHNQMESKNYKGNIVGVTPTDDYSIGMLVLLSPIITSILDVTEATKYTHLQTNTLAVVILFLVIGYIALLFFVLFFFN